MRGSRLKREGIGRIGLASTVGALPPSEWTAAIRILSRAQDFGLRPSRFLASACAKFNVWSRSVQLLAWLEAVWGRPDAHLYATVETSCARSAQWTASIFILEKLGQRAISSLAALNAAAQAAYQQRRWTGALHLLRHASKLAPGAPTDAISLVIQMTALTHAMKWSTCLQVLAGLSDCRVLSKVSIAQNAAANCCVQFSAWASTLQALAPTPSSALAALDPVRSNTILRARGMSMDWQEASAVLIGMLNVRASATTITHNTLLNAFAGCEKWEESLLASQSNPSSDFCDEVTCGTAMAACHRARAWQCSLSLLRWRRTCQPGEPDVVSINTAISATVRGLCWQSAVSGLLKLVDGAEQASFGACLTAVSCAREWSMALTLLRRIPAFRLQLDLLALAPALLSVDSQWRVSLQLAAEAPFGGVASWAPVLESASRAAELHHLPALLENLSSRLQIFLDGLAAERWSELF
ncbi:unnamed protein product [Symbiodinium natans]|uniref:Pentatricopeptide repeat-containing protein, chloroplastic n=1 Tax=Symbiodinium natans TaxID=878477 RepID=A0A812J2F9_9DINO|nr:unnamed protein product [Symbiodinium natans]